jgi:prepilin-type N-terminal cleavage/methylation domain-containing protein
MALTRPNPEPNRYRSPAGFSLTEVMVAGAIGSIILAGVLTSYILCARYFYAISNYWDIHSDGRYAVERFSNDMRAVYSITSFATNGPLTVVIPTSFSLAGVPTATKSVTYTVSGGALRRTDSTVPGTDVIATNTYRVAFRLYDRVGSNTTVLSTAKGIQVELFLRKFTAGRAQTEDYLSARLDMRNTP